MYLFNYVFTTNTTASTLTHPAMRLVGMYLSISPQVSPTCLFMNLNIYLFTHLLLFTTAAGAVVVEPSILRGNDDGRHNEQCVVVLRY